MEKKKLKRLLISVFIITFSLISYVCLPFFINFDEERKAEIERLFSDTIKYQVSFKGTIKYKLKPFPTLEISEVHVSQKDENSILNKVYINISIFDLLRGNYSYKKILFDGGELIVDLDDLQNIYKNNAFKKQEIKFENLSLKFFQNEKSFNFDQINSKILYENNKIKEINANVFIGEVPFTINFKNDQINLLSKNIGLNANFKNLFNSEKELKFTFNRQSIFPGINDIFASLKFQIDEDTLLIKSEKFKTNLFDGNITVEKNSNTNNVIIINGSFAKANFKSINKNDLKIFLENDLSKLSNLLDVKIFLDFEKIKTKKKLFNKAKFDLFFQKGDIIFENIILSSEKAKLKVKGRNIRYQKDNLLFYDMIFETKDLKEICKIICEDKTYNDKININEIKISSKGMLNINKAKIYIKENNFIKQYNDNEIKKLSDNLNSKVVFGKLENLLNLSKYFNLL
tara:strand:- start:1594 stop:2967 length:1374 start_codon:yes stop_codon:yes gene_type:complete